ncbi:MAG: L,D-transpeptidase [Cyanobacteria bacterium QS_1_48_34]|nr:MAG: L,D-transpeptidase [Cyanobacteria bacterium QS_1_48_34]
MLHRLAKPINFISITGLPLISLIFLACGSNTLTLINKPAINPSEDTPATSSTKSSEELRVRLTESIYKKIAPSTRLVLDLDRRQVTIYKGENKIQSYPVAVGRSGWETPTGKFQVGKMLENPTWVNPFTGEKTAGGSPQNPLGDYWISFWSDGKNVIGFHGTPNRDSVGKAASHGCVRMYNEDIEQLYDQVELGTLVTVVP